MEEREGCEKRKKNTLLKRANIELQAKNGSASKKVKSV